MYLSELTLIRACLRSECPRRSRSARTAWALPSALWVGACVPVCPGVGVGLCREGRNFVSYSYRVLCVRASGVRECQKKRAVCSVQYSYHIRYLTRIQHRVGLTRYNKKYLFIRDIYITIIYGFCYVLCPKIPISTGTGPHRGHKGQ